MRPEGAVSSAGSEAIDLAEQAGLILDPWQRLSVDVILSEGPGGSPAASIAGLVVPRQNGKGSILEALELAWLFLWGVPLISHSAHLFPTAQEAFKRLLTHIEENEWLSRRVAKVSTAHGKEGLTLLPKYGGSRLKFMARAGGSGRGFTADRQVWDEAYDLPDLQLEAQMPTLAARPDTQALFTSSAGMAESVSLRRIRRRAEEGDARRFAYLEWSVDPRDFDPDSEEDWARANPAYGFRISRESVEDERRMLSDAGFYRERLGIWDEEEQAAAFDVAAFDLAESEDAAPRGALTLGVDAAPDGSQAAIAVSDGDVVEVVAHDEGLGWVVAEAARLAQAHHARVVLDPTGPCGFMVPRLQEYPGVRLVTMTARDMATACGGFNQSLIDGSVSIRRHEGLRNGLVSSRRRTLGDAWAIRRVQGGSDVCVLVAAVVAHWGATAKRAPDLLNSIF